MGKPHGSVLFSMSHKSQGQFPNKIMFKFNHLLSPLEFLNNIDMN